MSGSLRAEVLSSLDTKSGSLKTTEDSLLGIIQDG